MDPNDPVTVAALQLVQEFGPKVLYQRATGTTEDAWRVGSVAPVTQTDPNGGVTLVESDLSCERAPDVLDLGGRDRTGADGRFVWRLSDRFCGPRSDVRLPVSFVATPAYPAPARDPFPPLPPDQGPVLLTSEVKVLPDDLEVTVTSWDLGGDRAAGIPFCYRALIVRSIPFSG
ncbi:MAG: hypothetical protein S0880_28100 [Actinomycetota bacterium]|nr:hypothetical protein [Actinomycetota bacterium]